MDLLTTAEAADYLRLRERKLYELVADGAIPCSKVTGKWLFPRHELDRWVLSGLAIPDGMARLAAPPIVGGSQDSLLEWALRESGSGLAALPEGSEAGVQRLLKGEIVAAGIHYHLADEDDANPRVVRELPGLHDVVLVGFARRMQGLLVPRGNPKTLTTFADVLASGAKIAMRQKGAGAQMLFDLLLDQAGAVPAQVNRLDPPCLTGPDLAAAILQGAADCGIATQSAAQAAGLDFVPIRQEHYDLVMRQADYFRPPVQKLLQHVRDARIHKRAKDLTGYDLSIAGEIRFAP